MLSQVSRNIMSWLELLINFVSLRNYEWRAAERERSNYWFLSTRRERSFVSLLTRKLVAFWLPCLLVLLSFHVLNNFCFYFLQLAGLWEEKLKEEQTKTGPLEEVCAALREALDAEHKKRMEAFESKMKPIIIKDGPSKKVHVLFKRHKLRHVVSHLEYFNRQTTRSMRPSSTTKSTRSRKDWGWPQYEWNTKRR